MSFFILWKFADGERLRSASDFVSAVRSGAGGLVVAD